MFKRRLEISEIIKEKSIFLLGPRQTGKSTLLRAELSECLYIDLLSPALFRQLASNPEQLTQIVASSVLPIVIDEIQLLPDLLNVVHQLMEANKSLRFVLTGSSARKLRSKGVNLLGGRARMHHLHPVTTQELKSDAKFNDWKILLERGGLPSILHSHSHMDDLEAYVTLYLKEEIRAESIARSLPGFSRFLTIAGACNGTQINYEKLASDVGVSAKILRSYLQLLADTLIGDMLLPFQRSAKRKTVSASKFYFFDIGIANLLAGISKINIGSQAFGNCLEHLVYLELVAQKEYCRLKHELHFWRTTSHHEVDFILSNQSAIVAIEVKGTEFPDNADYKGLRTFAEDFPTARKILVCNCAMASETTDGIKTLPAIEFFDKLWKGEIHPVI